MKFLFQSLAALAIAYGMAFCLTVPMNPETKFWRALDQTRDREIAETRLAHPGKPVIFFTGGSSCAFSIDPAAIEEKCGLPAFNLGLPVAAGAKYLLHQALEKTRPGDILVLALEPDELTYPSHFPPNSLSYGLATLGGQPSGTVGGDSFGASMSLRDFLNLSRPGPSYTATWLSKASFGKKAYRYEPEDIRYHGRVETPVADAGIALTGEKKVDSLSESGKWLVGTFRDACRRKKVHLVYTMPWVLTSGEAANNNRKANTAILGSIGNTIPAVDDGFQGVGTERRYFSDSGLHLSAEGSRIRSNALAEALHKWLKDNKL